MNRPRAFTLIELLLAMVLSTVVLAGLWTAMRVHVRMFQGGHREVEEAQLARALFHRIASDLRGTIAPLATASPASSSSSAAPSGPARLRGTARWLQCEVESADTRVSPQIVTYYVRDEQMATGRATSGGEPSADDLGLVRRELSATYRDQLAAQGRRGGAQTAAASNDLPPSLPVRQSEETEGPSPEVLLAPEVRQLEFRYFDGASWHDQWDSVAEGGLPSLVAVAIALEPPPAKASSVAATAGAAPDSTDDLPDSRRESLFTESLQPRQFAVYRMNVTLAAARPAQSSSASGTATSSPSAAAPTNAGGMP
ncbi:MAG: prepilin-type N-terminal cleavage/methylation domain-containing protein [Pirellulales bacterium]|nr:prepilin-type N-terminal cleavage/methylation domain-containing protein [Pirellulales bacterium]